MTPGVWDTGEAMCELNPPFGLLLDVDGPVANPDTRRISDPRVADSLAALATHGIPLVFNTGRSLGFLDERVAPELRRRGVPDDATVIAVAEKGATWKPLLSSSASFQDETLVLDRGFASTMRDVVAHRFSSTMFFDDTKTAMVSVEMIPDRSYPAYYAAQEKFDETAVAALLEAGHPVLYRGQRLGHGPRETVRVDPTVISTDIEFERTGKALGARRALDLLHGRPLPDEWFTFGDALSDYAMADWLHHHGRTVTHVDVRPPAALPPRPYAIRTIAGAQNDAAAAVVLAELVDRLRAEPGV